ncbi:MAG TPA: radical SAM protein [Chloroflexi bacterium]|nr:radical SAM protein [Chloroflexota bacterium]
MTSVAMPVHHATATTYQHLLQQAVERRRLLSVHWEVTHRCSERCRHCYLAVLPPHRRPQDELTTTEALALIEQMAALGALNLTLSGGEFFVRRNWHDLAAAAHDHRFVVRIFTNGLAVTPVKARQLAALHPYTVEISVYGADAATHDAMTQTPGSFARTCRAFTLLAEHGVRTVLKTPLMRSNISHFDALRDLAAQLGATFRYDLILTPRRNGDRTPLRDALRYADLVRHYRRTLTGAPTPGATGCRLCNVGRSALAIMPNGDVHPCVELPIRVGNVRHTPLRTIWESAPAWAWLTSVDAGALPVCGECPLGALCGRCHGAAHLESGDWLAPATTHCTRALAQRQALIDRGLIAPDALPLSEHLAALQQRLAALPDDEEQPGRPL